MHCALFYVLRSCLPTDFDDFSMKGIVPFPNRCAKSNRKSARIVPVLLLVGTNNLLGIIINFTVNDFIKINKKTNNYQKLIEIKVQHNQASWIKR